MNIQKIIGLIIWFVIVTIVTSYSFGKYRTKRKLAIRKMVVEFFAFKDNRDDKNKYYSTEGDYIRDGEKLVNDKNTYIIMKEVTKGIVAVKEEDLASLYSKEKEDLLTYLKIIYKEE